MAPLRTSAAKGKDFRGDRVQALNRFLASVHFLALCGPGASISPASDLLVVDVQEFELLAEPGNGTAVRGEVRNGR